jgi:diacylglycerol kinase (ATP)
MMATAQIRARTAGRAERPAGTSHARPAAAYRPHVLLVLNLNASGLRRSRAVAERARALLQGFGAQVESRWTTSADELTTFLSEEERRVVLVGGDGTLHAVANMPGPKPEVALLPRGRANNIAHALGIPRDLRLAARLAVQGISHPIDAIAVDSPQARMTALEGVSVGFHAQARARYRGVNSADTVAGISAAAGAFAHFEPVSVALEMDGEVSIRRLGQLFVVNFPFFGPRLPVAVGADPGDGVLEVVELDAGRRSTLAVELARLRRGTHLAHNGARIRSAHRVRIAASGDVPVVADTTVLRGGPVELAVQPSFLHVVGPGR